MAAPPVITRTPAEDELGRLRSTVELLERCHIRQRKREAKQLVNVVFQKLESDLAQKHAPEVLGPVMTTIKQVLRGVAVSVVKHYDTELANATPAAVTAAADHDDEPEAATTPSDAVAAGEGGSTASATPAVAAPAAVPAVPVIDEEKLVFTDLQREVLTSCDKIVSIMKTNQSTGPALVDESSDWDSSSLPTLISGQSLLAGAVASEADGVNVVNAPELTKSLLHKLKSAGNLTTEATVVITDAGIVIKDAKTQAIIGSHPAHRLKHCCRVPRDDLQKSKWVGFIASRRDVCYLVRLDKPKELMEPIQRMITANLGKNQQQAIVDRQNLLGSTNKAKPAPAVAAILQDLEDDGDDSKPSNTTASSSIPAPASSTPVGSGLYAPPSTSIEPTPVVSTTPAKLTTIGESLFPSDSANTVLYQGYLVKRGALVKNWKKRYFRLTTSDLSYFKSDDSGASAIRGVSVSDITEVGPLDDQRFGREFAFAVKTPGREYVFVAETAQERDSWLKGLRKVIPSFMLLNADLQL